MFCFRIYIFLGFLFLSGCNVCEHCLNGDNNYCQRGGLRSTIGIHRNGGFAKYCVAPLEQVNKLPNEVTFEQGGFISIQDKKIMYARSKI